MKINLILILGYKSKCFVFGGFFKSLQDAKEKPIESCECFDT